MMFGQEVEALAVVQPLLGRAAADQQFLDAGPKAAGQVFDERDRRGREHAVGVLDRKSGRGA
jgi:hypothetical protein